MNKRQKKKFNKKLYYKKWNNFHVEYMLQPAYKELRNYLLQDTKDITAINLINLAFRPFIRERSN